MFYCRIPAFLYLCILFELSFRLAYPCRYVDMMSTFARPVPELCMMYNTVLDWIYDVHGFHLTSLYLKTSVISPRRISINYGSNYSTKNLNHCWSVSLIDPQTARLTASKNILNLIMFMP